MGVIRSVIIWIWVSVFYEHEAVLYECARGATQPYVNGVEDFYHARMVKGSRFANSVTGNREA